MHNPPNVNDRPLKPQSILLSVEDQQALAQAIINPPPPNDALKRAAAAHDKLLSDIERREALDALARQSQELGLYGFTE